MDGWGLSWHLRFASGGQIWKLILGANRVYPHVSRSVLLFIRFRAAYALTSSAGATQDVIMSQNTHPKSVLLPSALL